MSTIQQHEETTSIGDVADLKLSESTATATTGLATGGGVAANSSSSGSKSTAAAVVAAAAAVAAANSSTNKFSIVNINNQFKGKSIEPQAKTTVVRVPHGGMQTLGKAVAARRMPPPTNLPSLAKSSGGSGISATNNTNSNSNNTNATGSDRGSLSLSQTNGDTVLNQQQMNNVSGGGSWPTPSQQSSIDLNNSNAASMAQNSNTNNSNESVVNNGYYSNGNRGNATNENGYGDSMGNNANKWNTNGTLGVHLKQEVSF
jgi:hypothetical protein